MFYNKELLATRLYELLDDAILTDDKGTVSIDNLLNPQQKYDLIMTILNGLPKTDFEQVLEFNSAFKVNKEKTHILEDFLQKEYRFALIVEELCELGFALGLETYTIYHIFIEQFNKNMKKNIKPSLVEVLDALTDILYVTYGAIDVFNLNTVQYEAMLEIHRSNMSKLIESNEFTHKTIIESVEKLKTKGFNVSTVNLKNRYISIINSDTGKVLKPTTYIKPDLTTIINNYLKQITK